MDQDFEVSFRKECAEILDKFANIILSANRSANVYFITERQPERSSFIECAATKRTNLKASLKVWHREIVHLNVNDL